MTTEELRTSLLAAPKNGYVAMTEEQKKEMNDYCKRYAAFMDAAKTEREATAWAVAEAEKRGYNAASRFQQIDYTFSHSDDLTKPFISFNSGYTTNVSNELSQSTQLALKLLDNENGFFLMVESCGTDKYGHSNNMKGKIASVTNLDRTLAAILLFMEQNPDTLLIVTSDHETGGVQLPADGAEPTDELFTTEEHTDTPVRVFAVGKGSEYFNGVTVDNTEIGKFLIAAIEGK